MQESCVPLFKKNDDGIVTIPMFGIVTQRQRLRRRRQSKCEKWANRKYMIFKEKKEGKRHLLRLKKKKSEYIVDFI